LRLPIIAVQIKAGGVPALVQREAGGILARQQKNLRVFRPAVFLKQPQGRERAGGFVAVDAGGEVKARGLGREARGAMKSQPGETGLFVENLLRPSKFPGGGFDVAQHGADVDRLAVIAAVVFAELLHAENFTQSRPDAKKFLTPLHLPAAGGAVPWRAVQSLASGFGGGTGRRSTHTP